MSAPMVLEDSLEQLHAMECAVRAQFLKVVADYATSETWRSDGARAWRNGSRPALP